MTYILLVAGLPRQIILTDEAMIFFHSLVRNGRLARIM